MIRLVFLLLLVQDLAFGQSHPVSVDPGCCSQNTALAIYTNDPTFKKELFLVYGSNKYLEKSIFYQGKFDPWKASQNKRNPLYNQEYIVPPNTLPIATGVFMDQTEVANIDYQEFLFFVVKDSGRYQDRQYEPLLENKYKSRYYLNPEFYFFPATGVDIENAKSYCQWRAKVINKGLKEMLRGERKKYKYTGRLPTLEEWKQAAGPPSLEIRDASYNLDKKAKEYLENDLIASRLASPEILSIKTIIGYNVNLKSSLPQGFDLEIPGYIYGFEPNSAGFYNMFGNVKELLDEGYAVGGGFKTVFSSKDALFQTTDDVQAYKMDIGFRCVTERKK